MNQETRDEKISRRKVHYFVGSVTHWVVNSDLDVAITKHKKENAKLKTQSTSANVYLVPVPVEAHYEIDNYHPDVGGTEWIARIVYHQKK